MRFPLNHTSMKYPKILSPLLFLPLVLSSCQNPAAESSAVDETGHKCYSGIYPHLAYYNDGEECGTGAVVPWMGDLWIVTYSPHMPYGSDDKLYQISEDLVRTTRPESIGGTPANRMIHTPTQQLFIGPYVIDSLKNVRVIPYDVAPGRPTGVAAHLEDPDSRVLYASMEAGFYDVDIHSLEVKELYKDGNQKRKEGFTGDLCTLFPGYHGKGFYSGQGVAVYSNNGEEGELAQKQFDIPSGVLAEWDGKDWKVVRRNQFTEVTGPGGIKGNPHPQTDPIWSLGWDYRSVILAIREAGKGWSYYRLPKASFAYDGAHGWNTEWPRIRNVGTEENPDYLMTMHGMFWRFPEGFSTQNSAGITPRGAYLKVIADFAPFRGGLVFGCDDSAKSEFLNKRAQKGGIGGPGQSNSNLWFTSMDTPDHLGPTTAGGYVWLRDTVTSLSPSDAFLFKGWDNRSAWIANRSEKDTEITFEGDLKGNGQWSLIKKVQVPAHASLFVPFTKDEDPVWIRAVSSQDILCDLGFVLAQKETRSTQADGIFKGLTEIGKKADSKGLMYGLPDNRKSLGILASTTQGTQYYELDGEMNLEARKDTAMERHIAENFAIPSNVVDLMEESILIIDGKGRRWRLPLGDEAYMDKTRNAELRICREIATERDILSLSGTFYELPAENADGYAKVRPVTSHHFAINDYASYRGMLMLSGIDHKKAAGNPHVIFSDDHQAAVWAGTIDDLWKMGKPVGHGDPLADSQMKAGIASDAFLIGFYDQRDLTLSHQGKEDVLFTLECDPTGDGQWFEYARFNVKPSENFQHHFPDAFQARWIRIKADKDVKASASFLYR